MADNMTQTPPPAFDDAHTLAWLAAADDPQLDALDFGVIGFEADPNAVVRRYNRNESTGSGLDRGDVVGEPLFSAVAQCMNNYLIAQRFADAQADGTALDETLPFVFTLRMRPTPVVLRLLAAPGQALAYVLVQRKA